MHVDFARQKQTPKLRAKCLREAAGRSVLSERAQNATPRRERRSTGSWDEVVSIPAQSPVSTMQTMAAQRLLLFSI
jgi:hypothetical protein